MTVALMMISKIDDGERAETRWRQKATMIINDDSDWLCWSMVMLMLFAWPNFMWGIGIKPCNKVKSKTTDWPWGGVHLRSWGYGSSWNVPIHAWHWMTTQWRWQSFDIFRSNTSSSSSSASSSSITKSPGDNWAVLQQFALIRAQIWNKRKANKKRTLLKKYIFTDCSNKNFSS